MKKEIEFKNEELVEFLNKVPDLNAFIEGACISFIQNNGVLDAVEENMEVMKRVEEKSDTVIEELKRTEDLMVFLTSLIRVNLKQSVAAHYHSLETAKTVDREKAIIDDSDAEKIANELYKELKEDFFN